MAVIEDLVRISEDYKADLGMLLKTHELMSKKIMVREYNKGNKDICKPAQQGCIATNAHVQAVPIVERYASMLQYKRGMYAVNELFESVDERYAGP